jgi:Zn-dependent metalloprotease
VRPQLRAAGICACALVTAVAVGVIVRPSGTGGTASWHAGSPIAQGTGEQPQAGQPATARTVGAKRPAPPAGSVPAPDGVRELRAGNPALTLAASGTVRAVTAQPGKTLGATADGFVTHFAGTFGLTSAHTITRDGSTPLPGGDSVVRYQQRAGGLPVLGGEVVVTTDRSGKVRGAIADTTALAPTATTATVTPEAAKAAAVKAAVQEYALDPASVTKLDAELWLYDPALIGTPGKAALRPTYLVRLAGADGHPLASVLVDAADASIRLTASERQTALDRVVCDLANRRVNLNVLEAYQCLRGNALGGQASTRSEGEGASSVAEVNAAYDRMGAAYTFFKNAFGRDSFDGRGVSVRATVRACHLTDLCPFGNAYWDGDQLVFGAGFATDDVVAHEFTHAVTDYASNLYYWHQSGAINEALSDIFGQLIDLATPADDAGNRRWLLGEDLPGGGAIRDMANPESLGQPSSVGGPFWMNDTSHADNGGVHTNSGPANFAAYKIADGDTTSGANVPGIGLTKSAQLWYRVMHVLPSGANYQELGLTLMSACRQLIGHFGFTAVDCNTTVSHAVSLTAMVGASGENVRAEFEAPYCDLGASQPPVDLFFDDLENGPAKWRSSSARYWSVIPNTVVNYSYAARGRGSVNGWTAPGETGHGSSIEMAAGVKLPTGTPVYAHFAQSMYKTSAADSVDMFIDSGSGWQPLTGAESHFNGNRMTATTGGYGATRVNLTPYAGRTVRLMFKVNSPANRLVDWYFDDFRIYTCDRALSSAPRNGYAYVTGSTLNVGWEAGFIARDAAGLPLAHVYELTYSPAIPGAPSSVTPQEAGAQYSVSAAGADPNVTYTVTVAVRTVSTGRLGTPAVIKTVPMAPTSCPTTKANGLLLPPVRKPPVVVGGQCVRPPVPKR